ncbi:hypothetical protein [Brumimicrobium mesophilum]|uniref:hypothetical protein n=1 Tax=Brumimicrobium mesophilum TaxID=392717 RepID=UPI00131C18B7|nr:hypothetical protein [Brumimicrobium mesophilum]
MTLQTIKYLFLLLSTAMLTIEDVKSQDSLTIEIPHEEKNIHSIGLLASIDCGLGLSYRFRNPTNNFGLQVSTIPAVSDGFYAQFAGFAIHQYFFNREKVNLYGYLGINTSIIIGSNTGFDIFNIIGGLGVGASFNLGRSCTIQAQLGLGHHLKEEIFTENRNFISPGLGVLYNF